MNSGGFDRGGRRSSPLLTEPTVRRAAARRRRTRRRAATGLVLVLVGAVIAAFALTRGGEGTPESSRGSGAPRTGAPGAHSPGGRRGAQVFAQGAAVDRLLGYTSYVAVGARRRREVALTFDDGPGPATPQILAILGKTRTPATFFLIGRSARSFPKLVAAEARAGFVIGNHTETHPFLSGLAPSAQAAEISGAAQDIRRAGAPYPRLFRPPFGSFGKATLSVLRTHRMLMVLWSVDTKDFSQPGVKKIIYTAVSGGRPGAIILMHDGGGNRAQTVAALPRIIARLRERGFALVSISQLIADDPPPRGQPPPRPLSGGV